MRVTIFSTGGKISPCFNFYVVTRFYSSCPFLCAFDYLYSSIWFMTSSDTYIHDTLCYPPKLCRLGEQSCAVSTDEGLLCQQLEWNRDQDSAHEHFTDVSGKGLGVQPLYILPVKAFETKNINFAVTFGHLVNSGSRKFVLHQPRSFRVINHGHSELPSLALKILFLISVTRVFMRVIHVRTPNSNLIQEDMQLKVVDVFHFFCRFKALVSNKEMRSMKLSSFPSSLLLPVRDSG